MNKPQFTLSAGSHNVVATYTDGVVCTTVYLPYEYMPLSPENIAKIHDRMKAEFQAGYERWMNYLLAQQFAGVECSSHLSENGLHCQCVNSTCPECGTASCCFCGDAKAGTTPMTWAGHPNKPCEDCAADIAKLQRKVN